MALDFFAGCLGGCAGIAVGHPFDTVKVRLQTQDAKNPLFRGTWHCFTSTIKQESLRGLYKGMSSPMAGVAFLNAIVFGVHGNIMRRLEDPNRLSSHILAGSCAGFVQSFVCSPMELAKIRMQIQTEGAAAAASKDFYKGAFDCLAKLFKTEGLRGVFRGQTITSIRELPSLGIYFGSYEYLTRKMASANGEVSNLAVFVGGGFAGILSWVLTYPVDVVKSRLQADGLGGVNQYRGIVNCFRQSLATEGPTVFTRGLTSTIIRAFPTNAATFAVVNWTMKTFGGLAEEDGTLLGGELLQNLTLGEEDLVISTGASGVFEAKINENVLLDRSFIVPQIPELTDTLSPADKSCTCRGSHYGHTNSHNLRNNSTSSKHVESLMTTLARLRQESFENHFPWCELKRRQSKEVVQSTFATLVALHHNLSNAL